MRCLWCRKSSNLKNTKWAKKDFYLNKGKEKLSRDLDIVNILEIVKEHRVMK